MRLVLILLLAVPGAAEAGNVAVDQTGYSPGAHKYVFTAHQADSFAVVSTATGARGYRGILSLWRSWDDATGQEVYRGDFSGYQVRGSYRIVTSRGDSSSTFVIADSVCDQVFRRALKGFYFQRCGIQLVAPYAGLYQHGACHLLDGVFHPSTDTSGFHGATGGWHDAGDYGKYVVNAGISVGTLLLAYEMFPSSFAADDLGIPESGNGVPDILDEARYELEWFLKMQRGDGGFWFKETREQFEGFVMPQADMGSRYIYAVSSAATGDASAVLARAAREFGTFDPAFAARCLDAARRGWQFLATHQTIVPPGGFTNPPGTATGEYGDGDDSDERLWAAAELFETTGDSAYNAAFYSGYLFGSSLNSTMWWGDVRSLALLTYSRSRQPGAIAFARDDIRQGLDSYCASLVSRRNMSGYHVVLLPGDYVWGSNSGALNGAILLIAGFAQTGKAIYAEVAADQLHYVLGVNGYARSYVTGLGANPPRHPHHRPSASDGVADPVPGLLVGGPNQYGGDPVLDALFSSAPPALCYADTVPSYASNEIAINWNAPLVFVAGCFRGGSEPMTVKEQPQDYPGGFGLDQNYPNPFNPSTAISYQLSAVSLVKLKVYDILGREVATLVDEVKQPGTYTVPWDAFGLASGAYYCRMTAGEFAGVRKLLLVR